MTDTVNDVAYRSTRVQKLYLPRLARLNTIASAPNLMVLVLKPFPSVERHTHTNKITNKIGISSADQACCK